MAKYSSKIAQKIIELIESGEYKLKDICKNVGIHHDTFYEWKRTKPEFSDRLKEAEEKRLDNLCDMAKSGLAKLLDVHEYTEVKREYETKKDEQTGKGKQVIKAITRTKKFIMPNPTAVIFTLTNREPKDWKNRQDLTTDGESLNKGFADLMKMASLVNKDSEN